MTVMKPTGDRHPELAGTLSVTQLARRWGTTRRSIRQMLGHGRLRFVQIDGRFRVPLTDVKHVERECHRRAGG